MPHTNMKLRRETQGKYYAKYRGRYLDRNRKYREDMRKWFNDLIKDHKCTMCPEDENACLDYHHIDPSTKEGNVGSLCKSSKDRTIKELKKCVPLCANCHRKLHAGLIELPTYH